MLHLSRETSCHIFRSVAQKKKIYINNLIFLMLYLYLAPNMEYLVKWCIFEIFPSSSQLKKCSKIYFRKKNNLLHVSDDSESIWEKNFFWIFWWNTRLRLTMGAIPYIYFLNPLTFCITGYKWTSLSSMAISEWRVCPLWCSKFDTFRKIP